MRKAIYRVAALRTPIGKFGGTGGMGLAMLVERV